MKTCEPPSGPRCVPFVAESIAVSNKWKIFRKQRTKNVPVRLVATKIRWRPVFGVELTCSGRIQKKIHDTKRYSNPRTVFENQKQLFFSIKFDPKFKNVYF